MVCCHAATMNRAKHSPQDGSWHQFGWVVGKLHIKFGSSNLNTLLSLESRLNGLKLLMDTTEGVELLKSLEHIHADFKSFGEERSDFTKMTDLKNAISSKKWVLNFRQATISCQNIDQLAFALRQFISIEASRPKIVCNKCKRPGHKEVNWRSKTTPSTSNKSNEKWLTPNFTRLNGVGAWKNPFRRSKTYVSWSEKLRKYQFRALKRCAPHISERYDMHSFWSVGQCMADGHSTSFKIFIKQQKVTVQQFIDALGVLLF